MKSPNELAEEWQDKGCFSGLSIVQNAISKANDGKERAGVGY